MEGEISRNVWAINLPRKPFVKFDPVALSPLTADQRCIFLSPISVIWSTFPRWWLGEFLINPTPLCYLAGQVLDERGLSFSKKLLCPATKANKSSSICVCTMVWPHELHVKAMHQCMDYITSFGTTLWSFPHHFPLNIPRCCVTTGAMCSAASKVWTVASLCLHSWWVSNKRAALFWAPPSTISSARPSAMRSRAQWPPTQPVQYSRVSQTLNQPGAQKHRSGFAPWSGDHWLDSFPSVLPVFPVTHLPTATSPDSVLVPVNHLSI